MKNRCKRIQLIYRINNEKYRKFWQIIDLNNMITLKHVWNNINQEFILVSSNNKYHFYYYQTKQRLPEWYHVDLLNDNDQILIEDSIERISSDKLTKSSTKMNTICLKNTSKKKQLKTYLTNRSFIITNKYSISNDFYQQWEEGKMHKNTNNSQMIF